jgi:hypothetical protein
VQAFRTIRFGANAVNLSLLPLIWKPLASFGRKPESSLFKLLGTPPSAEVRVLATGSS